MSSAVSNLAPRDPPFSTSSGFVRDVSRNALAAPAMSPFTNVIADGPMSSSSSPSTPAVLTASRARVFLYTLCSASLGRSAARRRARWATVKPRYSETNTASAVPSFDAISSTIATLSGLGGLPVVASQLLQ